MLDACVFIEEMLLLICVLDADSLAKKVLVFGKSLYLLSWLLLNYYIAFGRAFHFKYDSNL